MMHHFVETFIDFLIESGNALVDRANQISFRSNGDLVCLDCGDQFGHGFDGLPGLRRIAH